MVRPSTGKNEVQCPHCGLVVLSELRCSQCGMRLAKGTKFKWKQWGIVLVIMGGLLLFQLYTKYRAPALITIGQITPVMNFSTVRVEGVLVSDARKLRSGSQLYLVDDGTGVLAVFSNHLREGTLPRTGSRVSAVGNLSIGSGNAVRMQARSVEWMETPAVETYIAQFRLADVTTDQVDQRLTVFGRVAAVWAPNPGSRAPHKIRLEDPGGTLEVIHWLQEPVRVEVGAPVEVAGTVGLYKGKLQLKLWSADDLHLLEEPGRAARPMAIGSITAAMKENRVVAEGVLGKPNSIPGGVIYPLTDESGTILALFWDKNISGEERADLEEGVWVRMEAPVAIYKGKLELVPENVHGFQVRH